MKWVTSINHGSIVQVGTLFGQHWDSSCIIGPGVSKLLLLSFLWKGNSQLIKVNLLPNSDQIWFETQIDKHTERRRTVSRETDTLIISYTVSQISSSEFRDLRKQNQCVLSQWVTMFLMCLSVFVCALTSLSRYYFLSAVPASTGLSLLPPTISTHSLG